VTHYLWRAVDHEGEILESYVTKRRDRKAALRVLRKSMKRHGQPKVIVTDKLRSSGAGLKDLGMVDDRETGQWLNNRAENCPLPFRGRERAMLRFRRMQSLQKFVAVHSSIHNHFNLERGLSSRVTFKSNRAAALAEWRGLCAGLETVVPPKLGRVRICPTAPSNAMVRKGTAALGPHVRSRRISSDQCLSATVPSRSLAVSVAVIRQTSASALTLTSASSSARQSPRA
jgi:hypothetical protein